MMTLRAPPTREKRYLQKANVIMDLGSARVSRAGFGVSPKRSFSVLS
jgi:hypothetical protein